MRLKVAGIEIPDNVHYVAADFTKRQWQTELLQCNSFHRDDVSFCSALGVAYYLEKEVFERTRCKTAGKKQRGLEPKRVSKPRCLLSDKCVNKNPKQNQCNVYERNGQLVFTRNSEIVLPEDAPVRLLSAQLEELDYEKLYRAYSPKGRKSAADPRVLFKVLVHGYLCGIYSSRKLEEACRYR